VINPEDVPETDAGSSEGPEVEAEGMEESMSWKAMEE
jgi:hypothetical protein